MKVGAAAVVLAAWPTGCAPVDGPTVDRIVPAQATRGSTITVHGAGFCGEGRAAGDGTCASLPPGAVDFGLELPMARGLVLAWGDAAIDVEVPAAARVGATDVIVTVDGRSSNGGAFEVLSSASREEWGSERSEYRGSDHDEATERQCPGAPQARVFARAGARFQ